MSDAVFMFTQLDKPDGKAIGRRIFLVKDNDNFCKMYANIINDKTIRGTYTYVKEVLRS